MKKIDIWTWGQWKQATKTTARDNTVIRVKCDTVEVELFGNLIAVKNRKLDRVYFTLAGYNTVTTRARLNAILSWYNMRIYSRGKIPFLEGVGFGNQKLEAGAWYELRAGVVSKFDTPIQYSIGE